MAKRISTTTEPVTVAEAKTRLRIDGTDDDTDLTMMIADARDMCEHETGRSIAASTWEIKLDAFPEGEIQLFHPPVLTIESVTYIDENGATQTLASSAYALDNYIEPGWVLRAHNTEWPATLDTANAVTVRYTAGYGSSCPPALKDWILAHVGNSYAHRLESVSGVVTPMKYIDRKLDRYRVRDVVA